MRFRVRSQAAPTGLALLSAGLLACGGAAPPPAAAPAASSTSARPSPQVVDRADLSPVPEPEDLVGIVRWRDPAATLGALSKWTGLPLTPSALLRALDEARAIGVVAEDAPVDFAASLDPSGESSFTPFAAASVGLRSFEAARKAASADEPFIETAPGIFRVGSSKQGEDDSSPVCFVATSVGVAPARLVCAEAQRDIEALLPYMTRTLPLQNLGPSDVHVELRLAPVQRHYGSTVTQALRVGAAVIPQHIDIGEPTFDRALRRSASALAEEVSALATDAERLTFDATLDTAGADLALRGRFRARDSWLASSLASLEPTQAPAPESFWRLPASTGSASFAYPVSPDRFASIALAASELIDGWLRHEGASPADRTSLTSLLALHRWNRGPVVGGSGLVEGAPGSAKADEVPGPKAALKVADLFRGWRVSQVQDADKNLAELREAVAVLRRPKIKSILSHELDDLFDVKDLDARIVPAPAGLPKGSLAVDLSFTLQPPEGEPSPAAGQAKKAKSAAKKARPRVSLHLLAAPDKGALWIALGADAKDLAKVLAGVRDGAAASATLSSRPGLEALRTEKVALGGFFSVRAIVDSLPGGLPFDGSAGAGSLKELLESSPHRGAAPVRFSFSVSTDGPLSFTSRLRVPRESIEDLSVLVAAAAIGGLTR